MRSSNHLFPSRSLLLVLLVTSGAAAQGDGSANASQNRPLRGVMSELGRTFDDLERKLSRRDSAGIAAGVRRLAAGAGRVEALRKGRSGEASSRRLAELAQELETLARGGRFAHAGQAFEQVRGTCVACHARTRPASPNTTFPARHGTVLGSVTLLRADGRPRKDRSNVLMFLDGVSLTGPHLLPRKNPVVSQKERRFAPRVLPVLKGTTVDFPNDDEIYHNVFSLSRAKPLDLGIYDPGASRSVTFAEPGLVKLYCNIHPEMRCSIIVMNNPYFALSDKSGVVVLPGVPRGRYALRTWAEHGARSRRMIEVEAGRVTRVSIELRETRAVLQHRNKFGRRYPAKYK